VRRLQAVRCRGFPLQDRPFDFAQDRLGYGTEFFATPLGQVTALAAAAVTVLVYVQAQRTANRGLIVERVPLERGRDDDRMAAGA
jgi:hypothetical protein